jgi:cell division protein FtsL
MFILRIAAKISIAFFTIYEQLILIKIYEVQVEIKHLVEDIYRQRDRARSALF